MEVATKRPLHIFVKTLGSFSIMSGMKVHLYSYFRWCEYFCGPWLLFATTDDLSVTLTKVTSRIGAS